MEHDAVERDWMHDSLVSRLAPYFREEVQRLRRAGMNQDAIDEALADAVVTILVGIEESMEGLLERSLMAVAPRDGGLAA